MMIQHEVLSDYDPLQNDLSQLKASDSRPPAWGAADLVNMSFQHGFTAFQCMTLLVKNAFEGHVLFTLKISPENLLEHGTNRVDLDQEKAISLVSDFFSHLDLYYQGIRSGWDLLVTQYDIAQDINFDSLLYFILGGQLFKLPVSVLDRYEVLSFSQMSLSQQEFHFLQYQSGKIILENLGDLQLVNTINSLYYERFRELVLKIRSQEDVISLLETKLMLANDPEIRSETALEKKYFDFLVALRMQKEFPRMPESIISFSTPAGGRDTQQFATFRLKQLYRAISRNCSEIHLNSQEAAGTGVLKKFFIDASRIYNEIRITEYDYFIQFYRLLNILNQVLVFRRCHAMEMTFIDFTGIIDQITLPKIRREFFARMKSHVEEMTVSRKGSEHTGYKIKNICDEELAKVHEEFLAKHCEYLDERIVDLLKQISTCMGSEAEKNEKKTR